LGQLQAAVPDAERVRRYLKEFQNTPEEHIRFLTDSQATRAAILEAFTELRNDDRIERDNNAILIYYAGHGSQTDAPEGWESPGSKVQMILPFDYGTDQGDNIVQGIPDRTIGRLLEKMAEKKGNNIVR
jgi:hypothetical protein